MSDGPLKTVVVLGCAGGFALSVLAGIISGIVALASLTTLGPSDQVVVHYLAGREVVNGPCRVVLTPFRDKTRRKALALTETQYARVKNVLDGTVRMISGRTVEFLQAYEEAEPTQDKIVVRREEYLRLYDRVTGTERVVRGATSLVPGPWEDLDEHGAQQARFVDKDSAVLVLNRQTGSKRLATTVGVLYPDAYEDFAEVRRVIRLLPHERMVVRNALGQYIVYSGAGPHGNATGLSFFLQPFDRVVTMRWSTFLEPEEGQRQVADVQTITRIDMRMRRVFFQFDTRTNDNVQMNIEGSIYWNVVDVAKVVNNTDDPAGDVWHKARSTMISTISKIDLETFMASFGQLIVDAFNAQISDGFYEQRGVQVHHMQVSRYDCEDPHTSATLREIIQETTNRMNRLQAQRSENDVKAARILADITRENQQTVLITSQAVNERLEASLEGESDGIRLAKSITSFVDRANRSAQDTARSLTMYKLHKRLQNQNSRTRHIASGNATLFMTAEQLNFESVSLPHAHAAEL
uniref:Band 7 domain-containing protein n=1 Tax=Zooxanthella nutricula TaxID=1333877 RepID=A0A6V0FZT6_9DINO|mmetsp:Transcript_88283/g.270136  ORF Transcript_88283/g.270136 Transcript_88283/m.270136 type:complete len:523 (+) Transcript_88283:81-1649(+)